MSVGKKGASNTSVPQISLLIMGFCHSGVKFSFKITVKSPYFSLKCIEAEMYGNHLFFLATLNDI